MKMVKLCSGGFLPEFFSSRKNCLPFLLFIYDELQLVRSKLEIPEKSVLKFVGRICFID